MLNDILEITNKQDINKILEKNKIYIELNKNELMNLEGMFKYILK